MRNAYEIIQCNNEAYLCIIMPTSCYNPLDNIEQLIKQLEEKKIKEGYVLFDFIISTGNSSERFATAYYDDGLVSGSFKYINIDKNDSIRKISSDFIRKETYFYTHSMLSDSQVSLIKSGVSI